MKAKIQNSTAVCRLCTEVDVDKVHVYFSCVKYKGCGRDFMQLLRAQSQNQFTEEDILNMRIGIQTPLLAWLVGNHLHFVINSREKCDSANFKVYLSSELETLRRTKYCDESFARDLMLMVERIDQ